MEFFATSLFWKTREKIYIVGFLSGEGSEIGEIAVVKLLFMSDGFFSKFFPHN